MSDFDLAAYDFDLPEGLIAQRPAERRDGARLLVLDRATGARSDRRVTDLPALLRAGDALVLNDTRVVPARLVGHREREGDGTGGRAELFLVEEAAPGVWSCLARPGRRLQPGARVRFLDATGAVALVAEVLAVEEGGRRRVRFEDPRAPGAPLGREAFDAAVERVGRMPLPPYVRRPEPDAADRERYQTVYARARGAVAAPTAGLHFTPELLGRVRAAGVDTATITLHVGYGTFEPVRTDDLRTHAVAPERVVVDAAAADAANAARARGGRLVAVGTTSVRALESATGADGRVHPFDGPTGLTVLPGHRFRAVDALLTNFHLPKSSLLVLVAAFAGRERTLAAYRHAVAEGYRFYSYGDAMLVV